MFCGELVRPAGGIMCVGERPTLLAAQLATEAQAHDFARTETVPASIRPIRAVPGSAGSQGLRRRPGDTDREIYLRLTTGDAVAATAA